MSVSEEVIQQTSLSTVVTIYPNLLISPSLSGIHLPGTPEQKSRIIANLKRTSQFRRGIPDITIFCPEGKVVNLEYKKPTKGIQSNDQKEVEQILLDLSHNYYIVTSLTETLQALANNLPTTYRTKCMNELLSNLDTTLTTDFLFFKKGTSKANVETELKTLYHL